MYSEIHDEDTVSYIFQQENAIRIFNLMKVIISSINIMLFYFYSISV